MLLIRKLLYNHKWPDISEQTYTEHYNKYNGSVITHPDITKKISKLINIDLKFKGYYKNNILIAAAPVWDKHELCLKTALKKNNLKKHIDLGNAFTRLPIKNDINDIDNIPMPFTAEYLIIPDNLNIKLLNIKASKDKYIAIAKPADTWKKKVKYNRNRAKKIFLDNNKTSIKPISDFDSELLANWYLELFAKRWGFTATGAKLIPSIFNTLKDYLFGHILFYNNKPIAIQYILAVINKNYFNLEYINGGYDPSYENLSPGSILTAINIEHASNIALEKNLELFYSFGKYSDNYKKIWCNPVNIYRLT